MRSEQEAAPGPTAVERRARRQHPDGAPQLFTRFLRRARPPIDGAPRIVVARSLDELTEHRQALDDLAAEWLVRQDPMLVGADNFPVEVSPNPDSQISAPVHQIMLVINGIHLLENLKLDELASKRVHEFAFVMQPLKLKGATGSTVAPIAIR